jgi:hypothetical protein
MTEQKVNELECDLAAPGQASETQSLQYWPVTVVGPGRTRHRDGRTCASELEAANLKLGPCIWAAAMPPEAVEFSAAATVARDLQVERSIEFDRTVNPVLEPVPVS